MNRPPRTKLVMALGGVFLAASAFFADAAGLGRLSVNSSLGQPLSAEIELMSLQPGEFESIAARVASPEAYTDARVEYSPLLRQLRFSVERRADGKPIVKVTSLAPINEPFLDVLVEMSWPSGKLLREYPILLDPPGFSEARVAAPAVAPRAAAPSVPAATVAAPTISRPAPASSLVRDAPGDTYGPVKAGDTLNKIASSVKPDTVSLEQMLVALYRENKSAFIGNNMNQLKTGQILRVPTSVDIGKITRAEAQSEIKVQVADWKGYRDSVAGAAQSMAPKASAANEGAGKIAVAKPDKPTASAATGDQLKIAKSDSGNAKVGSAGAKGSVQEQLNALREESIAKDNRLKEANSRVAELEKQIAKMRELADLKGVAPPAKADAKPADTKTAKVDEKPKAPEPAKVVAPPPAVTPPVDAKVAQVTPTPAKPAELAKVEAPKADAPKVDAATPAVVPPKAPDAKPAVAKTPPPAPAPEPSFIEENAVALGATTAAILGGAGLFFMSRRKKKPVAPPSSQLVNTSSIMPSDMKPNTVTGNRAGGLVDTGNSSFLTDFDKTGPGMIDTDEVDPVAEAEVYIAYGRDAQAEEILKEAMGRDKNRHEIAVKLLEIYHSRKSPQAFEPVARELKDAIGVDNPTWAKVASLGASIDPTNSLYGGSGAAASVATVAAAGGALIAGAGAAVAAATASPAAPSVPDVDFDLGFTETAQPSAASPSGSHDKVAHAQKPVMDFDLDLNSPTSSVSSVAAPAAPEASSTLDFDLAFDVPSDTPSSPAAPTPAAKETSSSTFDFDLSSLSLDAPPAAKPAASATPAAASSAAAGLEQIFATTINAKASDLSPTHAKPAADNLSGVSFDMGSGSDGDSGSGSAAATKLELAKAYIEIGDADGAKEILHEVVREGSPAQREAASKILSGI